MKTDIEEAAQSLAAVVGEIRKVIAGQQDVIDQAIMGLVSGGHVLVEGVPGLGKTLLVKALARTIGGSFARIQFTPDLMPSDVTGHTLYDPASGKFATRKGPIFAHFVIADEVNRAPAKTQAALLEVMQEAQVTIEEEWGAREDEADMPALGSVPEAEEADDEEFFDAEDGGDTV